MSRPQRNRRLSRRVWSLGHDSSIRPVKRLFTPEIKRMLKDWLIRRRDNPYPSRDEKKRLAIETGLTYTQICNWFANWRRKLKNSKRERVRNSWGNLIKNYNTNARGNVEQFSISSEDSIWEEELEDDMMNEDDLRDDGSNDAQTFANISAQRQEDHSRYAIKSKNYKPNYYIEAVNIGEASYLATDNNNNMTKVKALQKPFDFSTNLIKTDSKICANAPHTTKYKQKIMEKYLRSTYAEDQKSQTAMLDVETLETPAISGAAELNKWLESTAKFMPNKKNYYVECNKSSKQVKERCHKTTAYFQSSQESTCIPHLYASIHHKDELDAAETLANLAFNCRQRILKSKTTIPKPVNAINS